MRRPHERDQSSEGFLYPEASYRWTTLSDTLYATRVRYSHTNCLFLWIRSAEQVVAAETESHAVGGKSRERHGWCFRGRSRNFATARLVPNLVGIMATTHTHNAAASEPYGTTDGAPLFCSGGHGLARGLT